MFDSQVAPRGSAQHFERQPPDFMKPQHSGSSAIPARFWRLWRPLNLLPFVAALGFVTVYSVDVPYSDQWWLPGLFTAVARGQGLSWNLLRCNNVHPVLFPKLVWIVLGFTTRWNLRVDMAATLVTILAVFALCALMANSEGHGRPTWQIAVSNLITSLLLFSFVHFDTFLWGFQVSFALVNLAVIAAIYLLSTSPANPIRALVLAWACCTVASFSSLQGMLSWIVILPCLVICFTSKRARSIATCATLALGAACLALYFTAFIRDTPLSSDTFWSKHPGAALQFFLAVLGAPLAEGTHGAASVVAWLIGGVLLLLFAFSVCWTVLGKTESRAAIPWISIGLFGLGFAVMTAMGRSSWGAFGAVTAGSRFMSVSVLLSVAVVHLGRQVLTGREWGRLGFLGLAVLVGAGTIAGSAASIPAARQSRQGRLRASACLEVLGYIDPRTDSNLESCLFPIAVPVPAYVQFVRQPAELLSNLGWRKIAVHVPFIDKPAADYGSVDLPPGGDTPEVVRSGDWIHCSGWAVIPGGDRLPKFVLFAVNDERQFIYAARLGNPERPDIAAGLHNPLMVQSGWEEWIPAKFLPAGPSRLTVWAYDDQREEFVRLNGARLITKN